MNVADLRSAGDALHEALGREYYLTGAGLNNEPAFQEIYDRFHLLLDDEALDAARESGSRELLEWIVGLRIGRKTASLDERELVWERNEVLRVAGQEVAYLRASIELANCPDREFRIALDAERSRRATECLDGLRRTRLELGHSEVRQWRGGDYVKAVSALSGIDLDSLGAAAGQFLDTSADLYADSLATLVRRRMGLKLSQLVRADAGWAFRADSYDAAFPPTLMLDTAVLQMSEMGLDAERGGRVKFDTEEREGKRARAFCVPVCVPEEVYLVLRPRGGHADFRAFWHELGHAMHYAAPSRDLAFEARWLGDSSVTEGFAMLWDHLTLSPLWLRAYVDLTGHELRDLVFEVGVQELYMVGRYAAKLIYELSLHRSGLKDMGAEYAERLTSATRFQYDEADHLGDVDAGFYAARYLRAWQLEALLAGVLRERFDEGWFRNPAAGGLVDDLMACGQAQPAHELAACMAASPLTFDPVYERLEDVLG